MIPIFFYLERFSSVFSWQEIKIPLEISDLFFCEFKDNFVWVLFVWRETRGVIYSNEYANSSMANLEITGLCLLKRVKNERIEQGKKISDF